MSKNETLTAKQYHAIQALLLNPSVADAATACGVGHSTMYRWLGDTNFRAALAEAESVAIDAAARRLAGLTEDAVQVLGAILNDPDAKAPVRLRASETVLEQAMKLRELRNLEERLKKIEEALGDKNN